MPTKRAVSYPLSAPTVLPGGALGASIQAAASRSAVPVAAVTQRDLSGLQLCTVHGGVLVGKQTRRAGLTADRVEKGSGDSS